MEWQKRTLQQIGYEAYIKLRESNVLLLGVGGVGSFCSEFLIRAGIGNLTIADSDVVNVTNINRQLCALNSTIGKQKTDVMRERLLDINPEANIAVVDQYLKDDTMKNLILSRRWDYIVDAIDTLSPKVYLIYHAVTNNYRIVSSMGAGGKHHPEFVKVVDMKDSYNCQLASALRKKLHKLGIYKGVKVVFSSEFVEKEKLIVTNEELNKKSIVGTISYMPALFGLHCAATVINDILDIT